MVSIKEIGALEDVRETESRWSNLLSKSNNQVPYFSFHWYYCALETVDKDKRPLLVFFESCGEDIALVPLVYKPQYLCGFRYYALSFIQNPYCPYQGFIYLGDFGKVLHALVEYLRKRFGQFFYIDLDEVRLTSEEAKAFEGLAEKGVLTYQEEKKPGSRYLLLGESFEGKVASLKKKTQKEFRRKMKRLSELGELDLIRIQGDRDVEKHLDLFFRFYARTWKGKEPYPEFYYKLFRNFDRMGGLRFYGLTLNGEPIAYLVCILGRTIIYGIKTTYNPSYYAFSPGVILFYKCIEDMYNIPEIREFDIGRGDEQFKREWTSIFHDHSKIAVYPKTAFWDITSKIRYGMLPLLKENSTFNKAYSFFRSILTNGREDSDEGKKDEEENIGKSVSRREFKDRPEPENLLALPARTEDLNHLVVAMASPNIKGVQNRLEKQECVLVWQDTTVVAFFWISSEEGGPAKNEGSGKANVDQWGVKLLAENVDIETDCIHLLFKFLQGKGKDVKRIELRSGKRY